MYVTVRIETVKSTYLLLPVNYLLNSADPWSRSLKKTVYFRELDQYTKYIEHERKKDKS